MHDSREPELREKLHYFNTLVGEGGEGGGGEETLESREGRNEFIERGQPGTCL